MKMHAFLFAVVLLLALNGVFGEPDPAIWHAPQRMFVFGDSFVDSGNLPKTDQGHEMTRQWYYPYGVSNDEVTATQPKPTGRFSDFLVQSDFIAQMLGLPLSPPTYQSRHGRYVDTDVGMNFAFAGTGVNHLSMFINLRAQVNEFINMVKSGAISKNQVTHSVALLSTNGNDYKRFGIHKNMVDIIQFSRNMTTEIAANVDRLRNIGVKRILVNNLHPLGCTPSLSRGPGREYKACDDMANKVATVHNAYLKMSLGTNKGVLIVDLNTAFANIIGHSNQYLAEDSESSFNQFNNKRKPCCEAIHPKGFCGKQGEKSEPLYSLCADPTNHFFWDDAHPTHAGWEAVIKQLHDPIKKFLGVV